MKDIFPSPSHYLLGCALFFSSLVMLGCDRKSSMEVAAPKKVSEMLTGAFAQLPKSCQVVFSAPLDEDLYQKMRETPVAQLWNAVSKQSINEPPGLNRYSDENASDSDELQQRSLDEAGRIMKIAQSSKLLSNPEQFLKDSVGCVLTDPDRPMVEESVDFFSSAALRVSSDQVLKQLDIIEGQLRAEGFTVKRDSKGPVTVFSVTLPAGTWSSDALHNRFPDSGQTTSAKAPQIVTIVLSPERLTVSSNLVLAMRGSKGFAPEESLAGDPVFVKRLNNIKSKGDLVGILYVAPSPQLQALTRTVIQSNPALQNHDLGYGVANGLVNDSRRSSSGTESLAAQAGDSTFYGLGVISFDSSSPSGKFIFEASISSDNPQEREGLARLASGLSSLKSPAITAQTALSVSVAAGSVAQRALPANGLPTQGASAQAKSLAGFESILSSLTLALGAPVGASPFPDLFLVADSTDSAQLLKLAKKSLSESGLLSPWRTQEIEGVTAELAMSPLGVGAFLVATDGALVGATSQDGLVKLIRSEKDSSIGGASNTADQEKSPPNGTVFHLQSSGRKLLELVRGMQSTLSMFTGGAASTDLEGWDKLDQVDTGELSIRVEPDGAVTLLGSLG